MRNPRRSSLPSRVILGLDEPSTYVHHSDEETFFGSSVRDFEGIDSARHVAISPDQDERPGHDDWFSDDQQEPPKVVAAVAAAVGQPDVDLKEEEISAKNGLAVDMTAAKRDYYGEESHTILPH